MTRFRVKVVGEKTSVDAQADEFQIDTRGTLSLLVRSGDTAERFMVFAPGQWQYFSRSDV